MSELTFRYRYDDSLPRDDFGWLDVVITTKGFSGHGGFWVQWQNVKAFGKTLETYPVTAAAPLKVEWGYEKCEGDDVIVAIEIKPANATGDLLVRIEVADYQDTFKRIRTSFLTNYPDLEAFRLALAQLMDREVDEAVLVGH